MKTLYIKPQMEVMQFDDRDILTESFFDKFKKDEDELFVDQQGSQYHDATNG